MFFVSTSSWRTISCNRLELAGILDALLAIPAAGILQIIVRDVWDHRQGRPKTEPTIGEDKKAVSTVAPPEHPDPS